MLRSFTRMEALRLETVQPHSLRFRWPASRPRWAEKMLRLCLDVNLSETFFPGSFHSDDLSVCALVLQAIRLITISTGWVLLVEYLPRLTAMAIWPWAESPSDQAIDVIVLPPDLAPEPEAIPHRHDPKLQVASLPRSDLHSNTTSQKIWRLNCRPYRVQDLRCGRLIVCKKTHP